jgi:hypothetical protein
MRLFTHSMFFSYGTPLHVAARGGHLELCRLLLQFKADLEAKDLL